MFRFIALSENELLIKLGLREEPVIDDEEALTKLQAIEQLKQTSEVGIKQLDDAGQLLTEEYQKQLNHLEVNVKVLTELIKTIEERQESGELNTENVELFINQSSNDELLDTELMKNDGQQVDRELKESLELEDEHIK